MFISYHCIWYSSQAAQQYLSLLTLEMSNYRLSSEPCHRPLEVNAKCPCVPVEHNTAAQEAREESPSISLISLSPLPIGLEAVTSSTDT